MISAKDKQFSVGAFTFARGGSKGRTFKTLALLDGKPLIEYSIVAAQNNNCIVKYIFQPTILALQILHQN